MNRQIKRMVLREYSDTGQVLCHIYWDDASTTAGSEHSTHMQALVMRGIRQGLQLETETW